MKIFVLMHPNVGKMYILCPDEEKAVQIALKYGYSEDARIMYWPGN